MPRRKSPRGKRLKVNWVAGFPHKGVAPEEAARAVEAARPSGGPVDLELLIKKAKPKSATLHPFFEWDDKAAAKKYRIHQAKKVVASLVIEYEGSGERSVRAYTSVMLPSEGGQQKRGYVDTLSLARTPDGKAYILKKAMEELAAFKRKYSGLKELVKVIEAIDLVLGEVVGS